MTSKYNPLDPIPTAEATEVDWNEWRRVIEDGFSLNNPAFQQTEPATLPVELEPEVDFGATVPFAPLEEEDPTDPIPLDELLDQLCRETFKDYRRE